MGRSSLRGALCKAGLPATRENKACRQGTCLEEQGHGTRQRKKASHLKIWLKKQNLLLWPYLPLVDNSYLAPINTSFFMRHKTNYESPVIHVLEIHPESAVMIAASLYTVPGMDPGGYPSGGDDLF